MNTISIKDPLKNIPNRGQPIPGTPYKVGNCIGDMWIVYGLVGKGGMGMVYYVYNKALGSFSALKSFREEYIAELNIRKAFRKEAESWIGLEAHPHIVEAIWAEEISGRLYVEMDYIPPAEGMKSSSLSAYIEKGPLKEEQVLKWAIQFCYGMEHVYRHGIKCHRDIKPSNILIDQRGKVRITDFGLAKTLDKTEILFFPESGNIKDSMMNQTGRGGCGTPPYMPPEQFQSGEGDVRNDIYSFGVVLYEMLTGDLPYMVASSHLQDWKEWERVHRKEPIPHTGGEIGRAIAKCLAKKPKDRYGSFAELRNILSVIYQSKTGLEIECSKMADPGAWEYNKKGAKLDTLGHYQEAITCFDKALEIDPRNASAWNNKGYILSDMGYDQEAASCFDKVLEIDPEDAFAWYNKGRTLSDMGYDQEAISCYDMALEIDPRYISAWNNKGFSLRMLSRHKEAISYYNKALEINPMDYYPWYNKGFSLAELGYYHEAIICYEKFIQLAPPQHSDIVRQVKEDILRLKKIIREVKQ